MQIFKNMNEEDMEQIRKKGILRSEWYQKNDIIFSMGDVVHELGIIKKGSVVIANNDLWGNRSILNWLGEGQVFAESYAITGSPLMVEAMADADCEVLFLNLWKVREQKNMLAWYYQLIQNLLMITAKKNQTLSSRIFCTSAKTIRGRLSVYFSEEMAKNKSREFTVPLNRQQMAEYLSLDRSALSHELAKMKEEGLIQYHKNHFIIQNPS